MSTSEPLIPSRWWNRGLWRLDQSLGLLEVGLLTLVFICLLLMSGIQVLLRNILDTGISWADVFARHLVLWVGFLGASLATTSEKHIKVDALCHFIPKSLQRWLQVVLNLVAMAVCFKLGVAAYTLVENEYASQSTLFLQLPTWYFMLIMPLGFFSMALRFFVRSLLIAQGETPWSSDSVSHQPVVTP